MSFGLKKKGETLIDTVSLHCFQKPQLQSLPSFVFAVLVPIHVFYLIICFEVYFTEVDFSNTFSVIFISGLYKKLQKIYRESTFNNKIPSDSNLVQRYSVTFKVRLYDYCQISKDTVVIDSSKEDFLALNFHTNLKFSAFLAGMLLFETGLR